MARIIENSRGKSYFIKSKKTKKGNTTYYVTKKEDETCLDEIPTGYEVFEKYDSGLMFIRKKKSSLFSLREINAIKKGLEKNKSIIDYRINLHGGELAIYTAEKEINDTSFESLKDLFYTQSQKSHYKSIWKRFEERMQIKIVQDKSGKYFEVKRYCYRGSVDDWITIGVESDIGVVGDKYLTHIGKDSYYELFRY